MRQRSAAREQSSSLETRLERAREDERRELARALHDEVGQLLTGIRLELAAAVEKFQNAPAGTDVSVVDRLQAAVGLVDVSVATVRRITAALRPPLLDHLGLLSMVRWEGALFERRTGIRCRVSSRPARIEAREHVTVLYRILLEALTNVARHAHAGTVWIRVREWPRRITLEVRDNGRGISEDALANTATLGLLGMRERALAAGGALRVTRPRTGGTSVTVSLPLTQTKPDARDRSAAADAANSRRR